MSRRHVIDAGKSKHYRTDNGFSSKELSSCQERCVSILDKDDGRISGKLQKLLINITTAAMIFVFLASHLNSKILSLKL